jgi:hypothetical protein
MHGDTVRHRRRTAVSGLAALALVAVATGLVAVPPRLVATEALSMAGDTPSGRVSTLLDVDRYAARRNEYARAAAAAGPGSRVLAAVDVPSLLLPERLQVDTVDLAGSTSPAPHLPYFQGSAAKLRWLRAHGYRYVIATDPDASACLYSRSLNAQDLRGEHGQPFAAWAPYEVDWFRFLDDASSRPGAARFGSLIVVRV